MQTENKLNFTKFAQAQENTKSIVSQKKDFELIWKLIFILISVVSAFLLNKVYRYQTLEYFQDVRDGSLWDLAIYGISFAVVFTLFDLAYHYTLDQLCEKYYLDWSKFPSEKARKNRAYSLVKWSYSIVYYLISSIWAYHLLKNTSYFPTWLGGVHPDGGFHNIFGDVPDQTQVTFQMKVFYILQFGKHFSRFINHVFIRLQGNFFQYTLHHGLSTFLIFFSYLMNIWLIGIWVLVIHDFTQCGIIFVRAYDSYKNKKNIIAYLSFAIGGVIWVLGRNILFAISLVYYPMSRMALVVSPKLRKVQLQYETLNTPIWFMLIMLVFLFFMQIFWTYSIFNGILKRTVKKSVKTFYE